MYPDFRPGDDYYDHFSNELLEEATYFADGQIMDEDYVFGSFIQSKMYHRDIRCTDCHDAHSARLKHEGNKVCTSCHQHSGPKYDSVSHHHHEVGSTGALCVECHMPETTYMEVDPRRDHSIRIPRTDLSVAYGLPNACTRCHLSDTKLPPERVAELDQYRDWLEAAREGDQQVADELKRLDRWCDDAFREWYGEGLETEHFAPALIAGRRAAPDAAEQLAAIAANRQWPGIARATAIMQRGRLPEVPNLNPELRALEDPDPQVRMAAVDRFLDSIPNVGSRRLAPRQRQAMQQQLAPLVRRLVPLLSDPRLGVRAEAGRVLARLPGPLASQLLNGQQREQLDRAIDEYIAGVNESNDRGGAHLALGVLYESLARDQQAIDAYRTAIRIEPGLAGPRSNLAALLERLLQQQAATASRRPLPPRMRNYHEEIERLRAEELELLARDARLLPDSAVIQYRFGLAAYLNGRLEDAEQALRRAVELEPNNEQFLLAAALLYEKFKRWDEARQMVQRLLKLQPNDPSAQQLRQRIDAASRSDARSQ
jgi:Flp pilus assembly protein TadD